MVHDIVIVLIVCLSVLGCYAMYLRSVHEQVRAVKLALTCVDDVNECVDEARDHRKSTTDAVDRLDVQTAEILTVLKGRVDHLESKVNKLVLR